MNEFFRFVGVAAISASVLLGAVACGDSDSDPGDVIVTTPPSVATTASVASVPPGGAGTPEATFGSIERFPGGTAVISSPHVFVSINCDAGTLTLATTAGSFAGTMDCTAMPPADVIDRYIDKPITIVIGGGRLKIENPEAGSLDFPATDVRS